MTGRTASFALAFSCIAMCVSVRAGRPETAGNGPLIVRPDKDKTHTVAFWLETSLKRVFPTSPPGTQHALALLSARNRHVSFQACLANQRPWELDVTCEVAAPADLKALVRRVGYVPMWHKTGDVPENEQDGVGFLPGLTPDPLYETNTATVGARENQSFWITIDVPADARVGTHDLRVRFTFHQGTQKAELKASLDVRPLVVGPRRDFHVTHWWRPESIYEHYRIEPFGERWWQLAEAYIRNLVAHGNDVVWIQQFFPRREVVKRPAQMLKITVREPGRYEFDWSDVRRMVRLARQCGATHFEWAHHWIYWGVKNPMPVYTMRSGQATLLWPTDSDGFGETYIAFLRQYLPSFHQFLKEEDALDCSYFHLSDEPGGDEHYANYRKARGILKDLAPWMKVMDALSEVRYGKDGVTDYPIPIIASAMEYVKAGLPHWVYYCCGPRGAHLNRFMDTPLPKIRMSGWLFYRHGAMGFLHWGYNCWQRMEQDAMIDPFTEGASGAWPGIPYGDPFVVYPGPNGPLDSLRWEVFGESLEDYAMLQTAGVGRDDPLLAPLKTYADFPKSREWIDEAIRRILSGNPVERRP